ncbi:hypothetical protein DL765_010735 [Monosporascus sp. GIB2]|nr:hypothetical protein DL765_010735 [Monosporascus sp. GIB2]
MVVDLCSLLALSLFLTSAVSAAPATNAAEEYGYIVVGSGPGGGPLAVNLVKANYSALLLKQETMSFKAEDRLKLDALLTGCSPLDTKLSRLSRLIFSAEEMRPHFVAIEKKNLLPEGTLAMALTEVIWDLPTHTRRDGSRWSTRHLVEETLATNQRPLALQMNTLVSRILFASDTESGSKPRATGVGMIKGKSVYKADVRYTGAQGKVTTITARKEVTLARGAFKSPQLLI